jgi:hypothetical protein
MVMTGGVIRVRGGKLVQHSLGTLRSDLEAAMPAFRRAAEKYASII